LQLITTGTHANVSARERRQMNVDSRRNRQGKLPLSEQEMIWQKLSRINKLFDHSNSEKKDQQGFQFFLISRKVSL
jgi:hypothetical protein